MCTAATYKTEDFYFGRNLDYEFSYGESVIITPRGYSFEPHIGNFPKNHYAIIGMAHKENDYPLYYDAANEKGLCVAGLNFVGNAVYGKMTEGKNNVAQYEFIPWLLSHCANVKEARALLKNTNITDAPFGSFPPAKLHWIIADKEECITAESVSDGLKIYDNQIGVLANNPPFPYHMSALNNYMQLSPKPPCNNFSSKLNLNAVSRGMGAIGLPGDLSSQSRFVRAAFVRANSVSKNDECDSVSQFFHILASVEQQRGCCELENGKFEITIYSSCINASKGIYYYRTYNNSRIRAVDLNFQNLDGNGLVCFPVEDKADIKFLNRL